MDIIAVTTTEIQNLTPGTYAWEPEGETYTRVAEYPVVTGQGVFVNFIGGAQIGPLPLDTHIEVPIWG